ncbi:MAG: sugar phosphate isomerase/epimerase family protein [Candidatus Korobacteraceae bacterium]
MNRRTFAKTLGGAAVAGAAATVFQGSLLGASRRLKIGITGLIWFTPRTQENMDGALRDMSSLGYHSFETWGSVLADQEKAGALRDMIDRNGIPLRSAFMGINVHDPSKLKESINQTIEWGKVLMKYGGTFAVVNAGGIDTKTFNFAESRQHIISGLNDHGKALHDLGLNCGLHQHTGSAVDLPEQVYAVMEKVDTRYMKFAPDVGQLQKAGGDAAKIVKDFRPIVAHMHLKDYKGWEHFLGYCPLGQGKVDLVSILNLLDKNNPNANIMYELDGSPNAPYTPRETAEISRDFLVKQGFEFRRPKS